MKKETAISKPGEAGVGDTLEWLKRVDKQTRDEIDAKTTEVSALRKRRLQNLPQDDGKEWDKELRWLQDDLDYLHKLSDRYRKDLITFETKVTPEKRDAGESIKQLEGARLIEMATTHFRLGVESMELVVAQNWELCRNPEQGYQLLCDNLTPMLASSFEAAIEGQSLPKWVFDSVKAGL